MAKLFIFTGSGISVESGVPTYRADKGLWHEYDVTKVCDFRTWLDNYELVHEFYNKRRMELASVKPNHTHDMIAKWQSQYETVLITQNVDNLHEQAGSTDVVHVHGDLTKLRCMSETCGHEWDIGYSEFDPELGRCPHCGYHIVKPAVVFFNEMAPKYSILNDTILNLKDGDVVVVMGTSGQVIPIDIYLMDRPGYKILNNLSPRVDQFMGARPMNGVDCWDEVIYRTSSEAVTTIDTALKAQLL